MNKKIIGSFLAAAMIASATTISAFGAMSSGTVVIGNKAFDLAYANNPANLTEISNAIVNGGIIYVKDFNGEWLNNATGGSVVSSVIPAVVYKNSTGETNFNAADTDVVSTTPIGGGTGSSGGSVTTPIGGGSVTTPVDVTAPVLNSVSLIIGQPVLGTKDSDGNFNLSLAGNSATDMFSALKINTSEKATAKIICMGRTKTYTISDSGNATIPTSDLLGSYASADGISVGTLKGYLALLGNSITLNVTLTDASGNASTKTITITAS